MQPGLYVVVKLGVFSALPFILGVSRLVWHLDPPPLSERCSFHVNELMITNCRVKGLVKWKIYGLFLDKYTPVTCKPLACMAHGERTWK